ncbi:MAG: respiratory nitrate reductase subunit beta [Candidatus Hinthialibacter antarcticus]|nr:respiratory nitrate reductase subunit beta [Candidatus Hinthialibacter antarcticus]
MSEHQYAMVMDLNKCIGCQTCTMGCKKQWTDRDGTSYMYWNNVETQPGRGYPKNWDSIGGGFDSRRNLRPSPLPPKEDYGEAYDYDYNQRLFKGGNKPVMPHKPPTYGPNWDEDVGGMDTTNPYFFYLPRICNHCTHPACVESCPRKAIYKRTEDGIVVIDQERCNGYRYCIKSCPYKKIYFNEVTGKSEKCIFCYPRLEKGVVNACAAQCPGRIRFVGLLDDPDSPVHKLVVKYKVALGLFPEKGTHPNVYYIPPFNPPKDGKANGRVLDDPRLPLDYLKYLFGPKVLKVIQFLENELVNSQNGEVSEVLQLLIGRSGETRYRIVPKTVSESTPADVKQQVDSIQSGSDLTLMGTPPIIGLNQGSRTTPCNTDQKNTAECSSCALQSNCDNIG